MRKVTSAIMEIIEEPGKIPMEAIENVAELQAELREAGYISYLDTRTDHLVIERGGKLNEKSN